MSSGASVFESIPREQWVGHDDLVFAVLDAHPVSRGHTLVIPRRRIESWFDATSAELQAAARMVHVIKSRLDETHAPDGYNVGFNSGAAAGQTVFHAHLHVIPRYAGDVDDPSGGVRHAVMGKGRYRAD